MPVFRVERNKGYTVMSNHHLRNKDLSLKAKGLLSQMLSLPEDWDYTLKGLALINREKIDAIRQAIRELEQAGYIVRSRERDERGRLRGADYVIYEQPQTPPALDLPTLENPTLDNPTQEKPTLENPTQLNKDIQSKDPKITDPSITHSFPSLPVCPYCHPQRSNSLVLFGCFCFFRGPLHLAPVSRSAPSVQISLTPNLNRRTTRWKSPSKDTAAN